MPGVPTNGTNGVHASLKQDQTASAPLSTALKPNNIDAVPKLTKNIGALGGDMSIKDDTGRRELLAQARHLVQALETPRETMIKHCWAQPGAYMAITFGVNVGLFRTMLANEGQPCGAEDLAPLLGVEGPLLGTNYRVPC